mgnify:CR=1 FL=1
MKNVLLLICTTLFCINVVHAENEVIQPSTNVESPEHCYKVHCGRQKQDHYWSFTGGAVTGRNIGAFCFIKDKDNSDGSIDYYIYSVSEGKYVSYDPATLSYGRDVSLTFTNKTDAKPWKFNRITIPANMENPGEYYEVQPYNTDGTTTYYVNWYQGVDSYRHQGLGFWRDNGTKDKGSTWVVETVQVTDVAYNYYLDDEKTLKNTTTTKQIVGELYASPDMYFSLKGFSDYCTMSYSVSETDKVSTDVKSVDVKITQNLPFKVAKSFEDASASNNEKWYTLSINSTGKKLYYEPGQTSISLSRTKTYCDDGDFFCFVGNVIDGFRIYNKAAGEDMELASPALTWDNNNGAITYAYMQNKTCESSTDKRGVVYLWNIKNMKNSNISGGFCINQHYDSYFDESGINQNYLADRGNLSYTNVNTKSNRFGAHTTFTIKSEQDEELALSKELYNMNVFAPEETKTLVVSKELENDGIDADKITELNNIHNNYASAIEIYNDFHNENGNVKKLINLLKLTDQKGALTSVDYTLKGEWSTICLPLTTDIPNGWTIYSCASLNGNTLNMTEAGAPINNNIPYIINGKDAVDNNGGKPVDYQLIGYAGTNASTDNATVGVLTGVVATDQTIPAGSYILSKNKEGVFGFYKLSKDRTAAQYRSYLTLPSEAASPSFVFFPGEDDATGINGAMTEPSAPKTNVIYDLQGNRILNPQKGGIYIVNGKLIKAN